VQSTETGTTGSDSRFFAVNKRRIPGEDAKKRRPLHESRATAEVMEEKSVNMSSNSAWDSDWVADVSMVSFDFNKIASAVDEQVAALRDFVGGQKRKTSKSNLTLPIPKADPMDVEDVAIEVEYVEDSDDDVEEDEDYEDDPEADLRMCAAPLGDVMKSSLQCTETKRAFPSSCSEMLPAGQPSFEQKPTSRKSSGRTGYV
jgi:hypothetical protein